jgi:hypothetical protein
MGTQERFGDLKGNGFDLEATHLRDLAKLNRLTLAVCLLYVRLMSAWSPLLSILLSSVARHK